MRMAVISTGTVLVAAFARITENRCELCCFNALTQDKLRIRKVFR